MYFILLLGTSKSRAVQCPPQLSVVLQPLYRISIAGIVIAVGPIDSSFHHKKMQGSRDNLRFI